MLNDHIYNVHLQIILSFVLNDSIITIISYLGKWRLSPIKVLPFGLPILNPSIAFTFQLCLLTPFSEITINYP